MELEEKLKVIAEYDGWKENNGIYNKVGFNETRMGNPINPHNYNDTIPVYSKAIKEADEMNFNHKNNNGSEKIDTNLFHINMVDAIQNDDKLAFFDNLVNLILKLQKAKQ